MISHLTEQLSPIILASASPRRAELLRQIGLEFHVQPSGVQEPPPDALDMDPIQIAEHLALLKAADVAAGLSNGLVIGADTVVWTDRSVLGKPADSDEAIAMLTRLSNRKHTVTTGVALIHEPSRINLVFHVSTEVQFRDLTSEEIVNYVSTGEPMDKAGGYGIQGYGALLVEQIAGDYFNVVGFPLTRFYQALQSVAAQLNSSN